MEKKEKEKERQVRQSDQVGIQIDFIAHGHGN